MTRSEKTKQYAMNYVAENYRRYTIRLKNHEDSDIIDMLENSDNMTELIRKKFELWKKNRGIK